MKTSIGKRKTISLSRKGDLYSCWNNKRSTSQNLNKTYEQLDGIALCPICHTTLWKDNSLNNLHIDSCLAKVEQCSSKKNENLNLNLDPYVYTLRLQQNTELSGLYLIPNFITEEEEKELIEYLDSKELMDWKFSSFNGNCYSKYFGVKTQFGLPDEIRLVRINEEEKGEHAIPQKLFPFMERFRQFVELNATLFSNEFRDFKPNECNVNSYTSSKGHYLRPHFDDRTLSGPILMNLSLCGEAHMTYARPVNANLPTSAIARGEFGHTVVAPLPRRGLQLVSGAARWSYTHEIKKQDLRDPRRISITWRQSGGKKGILSKTAKVNRDVCSLLSVQQVHSSSTSPSTNSSSTNSTNTHTNSTNSSSTNSTNTHTNSTNSSNTCIEPPLSTAESACVIYNNIVIDTAASAVLVGDDCDNLSTVDS